MWGLEQGSHGLWLCLLWLGRGTAAALVWLLLTHRMLEKGRAGLCWAFPVPQELEICLLARASILSGKCPRDLLVTQLPGFLCDGAVWLQNRDFAAAELVLLPI